MRIPKKKIGAVVGGALLLILLLAILSPYLLNLRIIKQQILAHFSQKLEGRINFQRTEISFFPRPCVTIHQASLSLPEKVSAKAGTVTIYPDIFSLLRGKVRISKFLLDTLEITMPLPVWPPVENPLQRLLPETAGDWAAALMAKTEPQWPNLTIQVKNGRLNLIEDQRIIFGFQDIEGVMTLPPERLEIVLACRSNLWEKISIQSSADTKNLKGQGRIDLTGLHPSLLTHYLSPDLPLSFKDGRIDLQLSFETDGPRTLQTTVNASLPSLTLHGGGRDWVLKGGRLRGGSSTERGRTTITLTELSLNNPQAKISGKLDWDSTASLARLELEGREIDLNSARKAALALAGNVPPIRDTFEVLKGGKIPLVRLRTQGRSMADLGKIENLFMRGNLVEGEVFLPERVVGLNGLAFDLKGVKGNWTFSKGILEGKDLEARWGEKGTAREGVLRLPLAGQDDFFHLEAISGIDLAHIPSLLRGVVKDEYFLEEVNLIEEIKGKAKGKWILGERRNPNSLRVDVWELNSFIRYRRIPFPLEIQSGQVSYIGQKLEMRNLKGNWGRSSFSQFTSYLDFQDQPYLEVHSGPSTLFLEEIYPFVASWDRFAAAKKEIQSLNGSVSLKTLDLKGPLGDPQKWSFRIAGESDHLSATLSLLPGPVTFARAQFEVTPERFSLFNTQIMLLDASFKETGFLQGYQQGFGHLDFAFQGDIGPKALEWGSDRFRLPDPFRVRPPLSISRAEVIREKNGGISFQGNLSRKMGPEVFIDLLYLPEVFTIRNMLVQDENSKASFALNLDQKDLALDFKGNLEKSTLDQFLVKNEFLKGSLRGDLRAHISRDQLLRSTFHGKLQGMGLDYSLSWPVPVTLKDFSLDAELNKVKLETVSFIWDDQPLTLKGDVFFSPEGLSLDMQMSADGFNGAKIQRMILEEDQDSKGEPPDLWRGAKVQLPPLKGKVEVKLNYFEYQKHTWKNILADFFINPEGMKVIVKEANLCGVSTPG